MQRKRYERGESRGRDEELVYLGSLHLPAPCNGALLVPVQP